MLDLARVAREAGIVGAGGAGFPTHVKLAAKVDTVIANGAECEPLLRADKALMSARPEEVLGGLALVAAAVGAKRAVLALKGAYASVVDTVRAVAVRDYPQIEVFELENFYPAGDEQVLVYEVTGRIVPEGGIPLAVGCVVSNVVTLAQLARATATGEPVTARPVTIYGDVAHPRVVSLPVGTSFADAVALTGGATVDDPVYIDGGPMMGHVTRDADRSVNKRTSGILVLSARHPLMVRKLTPPAREVSLGHAVCCNCRLCTDLCPRFLLGHDLEPHRTMQAIKHDGTVDETPPLAVSTAYICCQCGICEVYACPLQLSPRVVYGVLRSALAKAGVKNPHHREPTEARAGREHRKTPVPRLIARLGLMGYAKVTVEEDLRIQSISSVKIPLSQHIGAPAQAVVRVGDHVRCGDLLGEIPDGALGARVHASIDGVITAITDGRVHISRGAA